MREARTRLWAASTPVSQARAALENRSSGCQADNRLREPPSTGATAWYPPFSRNARIRD